LPRAPGPRQGSFYPFCGAAMVRLAPGRRTPLRAARRPLAGIGAHEEHGEGEAGGRLLIRPMERQQNIVRVMQDHHAEEVVSYRCPDRVDQQNEKARQQLAVEQQADGLA
jgi:hypothetical protein